MLKHPVSTRYISILAISVLFCSCGSRQPQTEQTAPVAVTATPEVNDPLPSYSQDIQSSVKSLELHPGDKTLLPVTLHNTGTSLYGHP